MSINKFYDSFIQSLATGELKETTDLDTLFNEYLTEKMAGLLVEDHEKNMTADQMAAHIKKLFKMCDDEKTEGKFLKRLGKAAGMEDCKEKDLKACAKKLCDKDEEECDDLIHELEGMVGYEYESKKDDDSDDDKKKLNEGVRVGSIVRTMNGKNMVVLGDLGDGDVAVARLHHGKPLYRSQINLRSDEYVPTGETIDVVSKKDWDKQQKELMSDRSQYHDASQRMSGAFDF